MASFSNSCGVCDLRHITKPSVVWCTECDKGLCKDCQEHHSLSKSSRNHKTIGIEEYQKLPSDVLRITQNCVKHQEKFIIYCRIHESPCCGKCVIESHKECRDIENLDYVIKNVKTSNAVYEIEETLIEVAENLQKIRQHQQKNLSTLKEKRNEIEKDIRKTRATINNHLDKLQEDLLKQLDAVGEKENLNIRQLLSTLEKKEKEISDKQRKIVNIKQHATELQLFLSIEQIGEDISSKDDILTSLLQDENLKNYSLEFKINTALRNIISDIKSFGDIHFEARPCDIVLSRKKNKQAQIMVPVVPSRSIESIKLKKIKTIQNKANLTYGCCILPDGRMVFTYCLKSAVVVYSDSGLEEFEVETPCFAYDVVYISGNNALAVTSGGSPKKCITIIDLKKKVIQKTIPLDSYNHGIALNENRLICFSSDKGIHMINQSDQSTSIIVREKMPSDCYLVTFENQIYHTNCLVHTVTCYNQQGKPLWTFHNESILKSPLGIDVDTNGNVYVVGYKSNNIVVISPDGQQHREVLGKSDGLSQPTSLCYNKSKNQLLVSNFQTVAQLFDFV